MTSISSLEVGGGVVLQRNTPQHYENLKHFFNKEEVKRFPSEIHIVESSQQVANALNRAQQLGDSVGVRSGGHLPSKPSLIQDGILIDVSRLNRQVVYDEKTQQVAFGPAVRVFEAWEATNTFGRFFPFGHAPDVALGGFCLAGGQGFFMKGWGATVTDWIVRLEVVLPDGTVLTASRNENQDLFWAARGSGQAFFRCCHSPLESNHSCKDTLWSIICLQCGGAV
jgi:FAD/FMN-containing dehydrogenase